MRFLRLVSPLVIVAAACGDDGGGKVTVDAPQAQVDAPVDTPDNPLPCDYTEQADVTNDDFSGNVVNGVPEETGQTITTSFTICGKLDASHFVSADELVDIDGFVFDTTTTQDIRIDLTLTGAPTEYLSLNVYTGPNLSDDVGTTAKFEGDHAVLDVHVTPSTGHHELLVFAGNASAIPTAISYRATISVDQPMTRCPKQTGAESYAEARDNAGNGHRANDAVVPNGNLTADLTDLPEPTGLTIAPATNYLLTGTSADITAMTSYKDVDAFEVTTGATTNELAVRLNWPGTTHDLDLYVYPKDAVPALGRSIESFKQEDEFKTFAVKPNTAYWIVVANHVSSLAGDLAYGVSVCGATFAP